MIKKILLFFAFTLSLMLMFYIGVIANHFIAIWLCHAVGANVDTAWIWGVDFMVGIIAAFIYGGLSANSK
jgi:hypothetical protein